MRQITIIGTGLIGGSLALGLKRCGFHGRIVGCDRASVLERARNKGAIDQGETNPVSAVRGSQVVLLATPVGSIINLIELLGRGLSRHVLLTDVGSTKLEIVKRARATLGRTAGKRFLAGHPMAGKEQAGVDFAEGNLFEGATWFITPLAGQNIDEGLAGEFLSWVERLGAKIAALAPEKHDLLCAWVSHLPQMVSTALAASLVDQFGKDAPLLPAGGRALREMTRISASPYSMWRDIALTNKTNIRKALLQLEQRLAYIRENLDSRELEREFERAHELKKN
ncbi:MAG: prephenate dehydrogenase [Acidobacteria bacterium]|nr:prephenate dehydrogenase [Acidobacteriota bacterium]MBV9482805.1 prephenate dehydrogenase [Acidobacteriota bacterium]